MLDIPLLTMFFSLAVEITKNESAMMQYTNYETGIVQCYGVVLEGWTYEKLVNPSTLSTSLPNLQRLRDAIDDGTCKFVKLDALQLKERRKEYEKNIADGVVTPHSRKQRSDVGVKRKRNKTSVKRKGRADEGTDGEGADNSGSEGDRPHKRIASAANLPSDCDDE